MITIYRFPYISLSDKECTEKETIFKVKAD